MELLGKSTINPFVFYSGKISGYIVWAIFFVDLIKYENTYVGTYSLLMYSLLVLLCASILIVFIGIFHLGRSTRFGLPKVDTVLKTNGIYKYSRNPIYLAFNVLTLLAMIYTLNIAIIALGIYSIIVYHLIIKSEERFLTERFGGAYTSYTAKVRRYI